MVQDDKLHVYQEVTALFEAGGKPKPSPGALRLYWNAVERFSLVAFDAAIRRAGNELKWPARPAELRDFCRDANNGHSPKGPQRYLCHFHGDGMYVGGVGKPDQPSTNPTMWWCDRCSHFVKQGMQREDDRPQNTPTLGQVVRLIADDQGRPR